MKISFYTLGCKVNQYETEAIREEFIKNGWEIGEFNEICDAYLINTCTVTSLSDRKSRQMIRRAISLNPKATIAVCGCYAQISPKEIEKIKGVDIIIGTKDKVKAFELINNAVYANIVTPLDNNQEYEDMDITFFESKTRAIIKVQDGCNNFCSYCIIPYARGRVRSRPISDIFDECKRIADAGYLEIVLAGIHVCSYNYENNTLIDLIKKIHSIDKIERIRLSSIEPNAFSDSFLEQLKDLYKVCKHFHISLQSGCDETLKRMNRKYLSGDYKRICDKIYSYFPDCAITTDLIVGFPGETDEEFNKTVDFVNSIPFYQIHTFKYSKREGTKAALLNNQVTPEIKEKRSKIIINIAKNKKDSFEKKFTGKELSVLIEKFEDDLYFGHTMNYLPVFVKSDSDILNKIIKVRIDNKVNNKLIATEIN